MTLPSMQIANSPKPISNDEMMALFRKFTAEAFRLETLPRYLVEGEEPFLEAYRRGDKEPPPGLDGWHRVVAAATSAGKSWNLVRVVPEPVTSYFSMSVDWAYSYFATAGQNTRFISTAKYEALIPHADRGDFWLFDGTSAIEMIYSDRGEPGARFLHEANRRVERFAEIRRCILENSEALADFLKGFRPQRTD